MCSHTVFKNLKKSVCLFLIITPFLVIQLHESLIFLKFNCIIGYFCVILH